jgi:hypothetical protein
VDPDAAYDGPPPAAWADRPVTAVDARWLADLDAAYVEPPEYDRAQAVLRRQHVLVLEGPARTGRTTTALRLLRRTASGDVHRVPALEAVPDDPPPRSGWLLDEPGPADVAAMEAGALRGRSAGLQAAGAFLVVVVRDGAAPAGAGADGVVVRATGEPDAEAVLERGLGQVWPGGLLPRRVARLVEQDWVQDFLDARPLPADVGHLVTALLAVGRGELDPALAEPRFAADLAAGIAGWFDRHPEGRDRCLLLAAAVLSDTGFERVDDAARLLEEELGIAEDRAWRASSPRDRRLRIVGAHLAEGEQPTPWGGVPTRVVRFAHPSLAGAVLRHVWEDHDDARRPLVAWLERLALDEDGDPLTARRAAATLGELGRDDLGWLLDRVVQPWARQGRSAAREAAAVALAAVAADPAGAAHVLRLLRTVVAEDPGSRMAAVAATAYGVVGDPGWAGAAREDLGAVLAADPAQVPAVARSVARLAAVVPDAVLDALADWTGEPAGPRAQRARDVVLRVARHVTGGGEGTPLLLALAAADPHRRERIAGLWRAAWDRPAAPGALRAWLQAVEDGAPGGEVVAALAADLARGPRRPAVLAVLSAWAADPAGPRATATACLRRATAPTGLSALLRRARPDRR